MVQQLAERDRVPVRDQFGQPVLDRVVEPEPALRHQLQHDRGHEGLRDTRDPEAVTQPQAELLLAARETCRRSAHSRRRAHDRESARCPVCNQLRRELPEHRRRSRCDRLRRKRQARGDQHACDHAEHPPIVARAIATVHRFGAVEPRAVLRVMSLVSIHHIAHMLEAGALRY